MTLFGSWKTMIQVFSTTGTCHQRGYLGWDLSDRIRRFLCCKPKGLYDHWSQKFTCVGTPLTGIASKRGGQVLLGLCVARRPLSRHFLPNRSGLSWIEHRVRTCVMWIITDSSIDIPVTFYKYDSPCTVQFCCLILSASPLHRS